MQHPEIEDFIEKGLEIEKRLNLKLLREIERSGLNLTREGGIGDLAGMGLGTSFHGYIKGRQKWKLHKLISVLLVLELDPEAWLADFFSPPVETALPEAKVDLLLDKLEQSSDRMEKVSGSLEGLTEALLKTRSTS